VAAEACPEKDKERYKYSRVFTLTNTDDEKGMEQIISSLSHVYKKKRSSAGDSHMSRVRKG